MQGISRRLKGFQSVSEELKRASGEFERSAHGYQEGVSGIPIGIIELQGSFVGLLEQIGVYEFFIFQKYISFSFFDSPSILNCDRFTKRKGAHSDNNGYGFPITSNDDCRVPNTHM